MRFPTALRLAAMAWTAPAADKSAAAKTGLTPEQRRLNVESFEHVWTTVRDKHWDPTLGGLNWQAVHDELLPSVENATPMDQARPAMSQMLDRTTAGRHGLDRA